MAYTVSVFSPMKNAERISRSMGVYAGRCSISAYTNDAGLQTITAITKFFVPTGNATTGGFTHGICSVQVDGPSSLGFTIHWDYTTGAFRAFCPTNVIAFTGTSPVDSAVAGSALVFESGGGAGKLHATSAVGNIIVPIAAVAATGTLAAAAANVGTFGFVAVGFIR
jgi:hypothetical protein